MVTLMVHFDTRVMATEDLCHRKESGNKAQTSYIWQYFLKWITSAWISIWGWNNLLYVQWKFQEDNSKEPCRHNLSTWLQNIKKKKKKTNLHCLYPVSSTLKYLIQLIATQGEKWSSQNRSNCTGSTGPAKLAYQQIYAVRWLTS